MAAKDGELLPARAVPDLHGVFVPFHRHRPHGRSDLRPVQAERHRPDPAPTAAEDGELLAIGGVPQAHRVVG